MFVLIDQIGRQVYRFSSPYIPYGMSYLSLCCKYANYLPEFLDPGDCPCSWGQQIYDGRYIFLDWQTKLLDCDFSNLCTYRVCFQHRYTQYNWKDWWNYYDYYYFYGWWWYWYYWYVWYWSVVTAYTSECCWIITIPSFVSSYPYYSYYTGWPTYVPEIGMYIDPYPYSWQPWNWVFNGT